MSCASLVCPNWRNLPAPRCCAPHRLCPPTRGAGRAQAEGRRGRAGSGCARRAALGLVAGRDRQRSGFGQRRYLPARESCPAGKNTAPAFTFGYTSVREGQGDREPLTLGRGGVGGSPGDPGDPGSCTTPSAAPERGADSPLPSRSASEPLGSGMIWRGERETDLISFLKRVILRFAFSFLSFSPFFFFPFKIIFFHCMRTKDK